MSSSGVTKYDTLDKEENTVTFLTTEGEHKITFSYKGSQEKCHINDTDEHVFRYNIRNAIQGAPEINTMLDASGKAKSTDNFWISVYQGLDGEGKEIWSDTFVGDIEDATIPTFYTSHSTLNLGNYKFVYKDFDGNVKELPFTQATGYAPTVNKNSHITFTVDFWGIGTYSVTASYSGAKSKYVEIIQKQSVSIPLNGNPSLYVRNSYVYLRGQDGREQKMLFNLNTFKLVSVEDEEMETLPTNRLGMYTMKVAYTSDDAYNTENRTNTIYADIVYSVVLEADNSIFSFGELNEIKKTATITACTNKTADTLVLPDKYVSGGETYYVTAIGDSVFKDFTALKTVYMPATLVKIGKNAFAGCTLLEEIFTSTQTEYATSVIPDEDFKEERVEVQEKGIIPVTSLLFTIIPNTLTVPEKFTWSETNGIYLYQYEATPIFSDDVFAKCKGTIWLFDSEYNREYATAHLAGKKVEFYTAEDNRVPAAQSRFQLDQTKFSAGEIDIVKYSKLTTLENVTLDGNDDIVVTPYFTKPDAYYDVYRILNETTQEVEEVIIAVGDDYVVPDGYTQLSVARNVLVHEMDYISATEKKLTVPDGFDGFVYLPDTIYTKSKIVNKDDEELENARTVYKSGITTLVSTLDYVPDTLEYIGTTAFMDCVSLKTIVFGADTSLEDIGTMAFAGCTNLESIVYGKNKAAWDEVDLSPDWNQNTGDYVIKCADQDVAKS